MGIRDWFRKNRGETFQLSEDDIVVFVVGPSGSGKTSFIKEVTKNDAIKVGATLRPSTRVPMAIRRELTEEAKRALGASTQQHIVFVDVPSFPTEESNMIIAEESNATVAEESNTTVKAEESNGTVVEESNVTAAKESDATVMVAEESNATVVEESNVTAAKESDATVMVAEENNATVTKENNVVQRETSKWLAQSKSRSTLVGTIYMHRVETDPAYEPIQMHLDSFASTFPLGFQTLPRRLLGVFSYEGRIRDEKIRHHRAAFQAQLNELRPSSMTGNTLGWDASLHPDLFRLGDIEMAWQAVVTLLNHGGDPQASGNRDGQPEETTEGKHPTSETHSSSGDDEYDPLEDELPSSDPPDEFDFERPPSLSEPIMNHCDDEEKPASTTQTVSQRLDAPAKLPSPSSPSEHRGTEVMPTNTTHAILQLPVASARSSSRKGQHDAAESRSVRLGFGRLLWWRFRKTKMKRSSHPTKQLSTSSSQPSKPSSGSEPQARANGTNKRPSTIAKAQRQRRAVSKPPIKREKKKKVGVDANHPNKGASSSEQRQADSKTAEIMQQVDNINPTRVPVTTEKVDSSGGKRNTDPVHTEIVQLQVNSNSSRPAGGMLQVRESNEGKFSLIIEFPAWMCCCCKHTDDEPETQMRAARTAGPSA